MSLKTRTRTVNTANELATVRRVCAVVSGLLQFVRVKNYKKLNLIMARYGREGERERVSVCTNLSRGPQEGRADSPECRNVGQESSMAADIMLWELALCMVVRACACAPTCTLYTC